MSKSLIVVILASLGFAASIATWSPYAMLIFAAILAAMLYNKEVAFDASEVRAAAEALALEGVYILSDARTGRWTAYEVGSATILAARGSYNAVVLHALDVISKR